ncbi:hypothetical protein CHS0354_021855 [Potamilus streckersoni]|uniref:G-protein coupled receptors family 2 profile 2 domain-containing protein n=1 Tax=Potamilus streckersoni TaxID=2493646 RepID=A0AAE0VVC6_9BIVA|nr:hypothetical protein CHS0354_021855 [Potamilus streckersoni]
MFREYAYKECTENGTWYKNPLTRNEWTNYTGCVIKEDYGTVLYVSFACNIFTILLLIPACIIFLRIRQLFVQKRIRLHLSLFLSLLMSGVVDILWDFIVYKDRLDNEKELTIMHENSVGCRLLYSLTRYFSTANLMWMSCEGYYLHRLIVHAFEAPGSLLPYYISGWALSSVPVIVYAAVRSSDERYNLDCWVYHAGNLEWIIYVPKLLCIGANLIFLVNILRILLTQIQSHPNEPSNYRKAMKATFLLVPLFGLQQFVVIYRPDDKSAEFVYEIIASILQNTKASVVALIFCFFNGEVHGHLKEALRKILNTHSLRSSGKGSIYTQTHDQQGKETNELTPMYIPMSPSSTTREDLCSAHFTNGHTKKLNSLEDYENEL